MGTLDAVLADNRSAVLDLAAVAERSAEIWTTPSRPGKWSPSQVVEHVAMALEEGAHVVRGEPSKFPTVPALLRPVLRLFFHRVLKKGAFPKARTNPAMNPAAGPASPAEGRTRLEAALGVFEAACRDGVASGGTMQSGAFGAVQVLDYARFQAIHTRHHTAQIPGGGPGEADAGR